MAERKFRILSKTVDIQNIILAALPDAQVMVMDPYNDGEHFQAMVISPSFEGISLVKQHQKVMLALKEAFYDSVHALALKTFTPTQWEAQKDQYPSVKFNT